MNGWAGLTVPNQKERGCGDRKADLSPRLVVWHLSRVTVCAWLDLQCQIKKREGVDVGTRN